MSDFTPAEVQVLKKMCVGLLSTGGNEASVKELRGQYGNPTVRKDPPRWKDNDAYDGESYEDRHYGDCPPDYLDDLADYLEWLADKKKNDPEPKKHSNGTPYWQYDLANARLARGWAKALREGTAPKGGTPPKRAPQQQQQRRDPENEPSGGGGGGYPNDPEDEIPFVVDETLHGEWGRP